MTPCSNCGWPHRSPESITLSCIKCGNVVWVQGDASRLVRMQQPRLIRWLHFFMLPTDRGIGDTVERLLAKAGGRKIKAQLEKLSIPCGCTNRQKWLNDRYPNPNFSD